MMSSFLRRVDVQLAVPALVLLAISLTTIFSVNVTFFRNQLLFAFLSSGLFVFFSQTDLEVWAQYSKSWYIFSLVGLTVLVFLGFESRGAARWLDIFGLRLQFSEIFKPFLAVALASFLSKHENTRFITLGTFLLFLFPIAFLIYRQPDLGSAIIYVLTALITLMVFGFPLWWFGIFAGGLLLLIPFVFRFLHSYQQQRLLTFVHLTNDPLGTSYNAIQAMIAIGSGMFFGKGLGQGSQSALRFLPERHTDFIFATLSESLGFVGATLTIVAFLFLFYRLYTIFKNTQTILEKVFVVATFSLLFVQFFVNIGMNIGILPIVGVPLPFVSYGGSSLISNAIFLGIASSVAYGIQKKSMLEIR